MAIYQRARPTRFDEVVGQDHVKEPLAAAVARGAVGHAYLFSGPRGVGKTTTARLLAMAVNCRAVEPAERPCGRCESCTLVQRGSHPDVIELDAASNNSVDDVRELREKVRLAPLRGGTRVWILDEAHMLSRSASNALLKTLEEPPPGLLFVLATTESEKLPATVLSRCQHFRFRRLSDGEIEGKLERLAREAGIDAEGAALALVARAADGAMRDAESMLERLVALGRAVTGSDAEEALGLPARDRLWSMATALADGDLSTLLAAAADLYRDGFAPRTVAEQLARTLRDALLAQLTGDGPRLSAAQDALVRALHALDDAEERFVRRGDLYALEVSLIRAHGAMTRGAPGPIDATLPEATAGTSPSPAPSAAEPAPAASTAPRTGRTRAGASGSVAPPFSWHKVLSLAGPQLKAFLFPAEATLGDGTLHLRYGERHTFHFGQLASREDDLDAIVDLAGGGALGIVIEGPGGTLRRSTRAATAEESPEAPRAEARAPSRPEEPAPPADLPPSETVEPLPDGFWDAAQEPERLPDPGAGPRPPGAAEAADDAADADDDTADADDEVPLEAGPLEGGGPPRASPAPAGVARIEAVFAGRVLEIEPLQDEVDGDDVAQDRVGVAGADATG